MTTAIYIYCGTAAVAFVAIAYADTVFNEFPIGFWGWVFTAAIWPLFLCLYIADLIWDEGSNP